MKKLEAIVYALTVAKDTIVNSDDNAAEDRLNDKAVVENVSLVEGDIAVESDGIEDKQGLKDDKLIEDASVLVDDMKVNSADDDMNDEAVGEIVSLVEDDVRVKSEDIDGKEGLQDDISIEDAYVVADNVTVNSADDDAEG